MHFDFNSECALVTIVNLNHSRTDIKCRKFPTFDTTYFYIVSVNIKKRNHDIRAES